MLHQQQQQLPPITTTALPPPSPPFPFPLPLPLPCCQQDQHPSMDTCSPNDEIIVWAFISFFSFASVFYKLTNYFLFLFQVPRYWVMRDGWLEWPTCASFGPTVSFFFYCLFHKLTKHIFSSSYQGGNLLITSVLNPPHQRCQDTITTPLTTNDAHPTVPHHPGPGGLTMGRGDERGEQGGRGNNNDGGLRQLMTPMPTTTAAPPTPP
jgi:hypothetical protein